MPLPIDKTFLLHEPAKEEPLSQAHEIPSYTHSEWLLPENFVHFLEVLHKSLPLKK